MMLIIKKSVTHHVSNYVGVTSVYYFAKQLWHASTPYSKNKMKLLLLFVAFAALSAVATAVNNMVLTMTLEGGDGKTGYPLVTFINSMGRSETGAVCGAFDDKTAKTVCGAFGWLNVVSSGTAQDLGVTVKSSDEIKLRTMSCNQYSSSDGVISYDCTYEEIGNNTCTAQAASVSCNLSNGELATIVIVCVLMVMALVAIPIVVVCIYVFRTPKSKKGGTMERAKPKPDRPPSEKSSLVENAVDKGSGNEEPDDEEDPKTEI